MEKHKVLEQRLREKTGIPTIHVHHELKLGSKIYFNFIEISNLWVEGIGDIANMSLDIPQGEDCWQKMEEKVLKLVATLKG